jgi:glycogen operon protein
MATLLLSQGVPMISHGDELARTQHGNNNAYCQDNELSWIDWTPDHEKDTFCQFVARLVNLRLSQPVLRRRRYFQGRSIRGGGIKDVAWLAPDGREMTDEAWNAASVRSLGVLMVGDAIDDVDERGRQVTGDTVLVLLNAHDREVPFVLPKTDEDKSWLRVIDTMCATTPEERWNGEASYPLHRRTLALFTLNEERRERQTAES